MPRRLPRLLVAGVLLLLTTSFLAAAPVRAQCKPGVVHCLPPPYSQAAEPVWATMNAAAQGNYPGGSEIFDVAVVNSDQPPAGNLTLYNETVSSPQFPISDSNPNSATGLPVTLTPGQLIVNTIALQVPSNFTQSNFTANLVAYVSYWNGTFNVPLKLTYPALVYVLGPPLTVTTSVTTATQTVQTGTVSSSLFAVAAGVPSIAAVILLVFLARSRGGPKGA